MKRLIFLLLLLCNMCILNAQTTYPPANLNYKDGKAASSLLLTWDEGMSPSSKVTKYDNGVPTLSGQIGTGFRMDQVQFAVKFIATENTVIERIQAYISYNVASANFTTRIVGVDSDGLPDLSNVKTTFTRSSSVPALETSSWVELCPTSKIMVNTQDTFFVVLTADNNVRLYNDTIGTAQGFSYAMGRNDGGVFKTINTSQGITKNANWMVRLQTNTTLTSAPAMLDGYNFYKGGTKLNTSLIKTPQYQENSVATGNYSYYVKAVYNGIETAASTTLNVSYRTSTYDFENLSTTSYSIPESCLAYDANGANSTLTTISSTTPALAYTGNKLLGISAARLLNGYFIMPYIIPTAEDHIFSFFGRAVVNNPHFLKVMLSTTGRDTSDFTVQLDSTVLVANNSTYSYNKYSYDLSAYIGQKIALGLFIKTTGTTTMRPAFDDFRLPPFYIPTKDIALLSNIIPDLATIGKEAGIKCVVKNYGEEAATGVIVNLIDLDAGNIIYTSVGADIKTDSSKTFNLSWIPQQTGRFRLQAVTSYTGDTDATNDSSKVFYLNIMDTVVSLAYFGKKTTTNSVYPVKFSSKNSGSETIYFPQEINRSGALSGIAITYSFSDDILNQPVTIWAGETERNSLKTEKGGYIDPETLTKVFEGNLDFYAAQNTIVVPFNTPLAYNFGNLAIAFQNSYTEETFSNANVFYATNSSYIDRTSVWSSKDPVTTFEQQKTIAAESQTITPFPDIYFIFNDTLTGTLKGTIIDDNSQPLANVIVSLDSTHITTTTNASGVYEIPNINPGTYMVIISKYAYETIEKEITIVAKETLTEDFSMERLPTIKITGVVIDSITGTPITNAYLSIDNNTDKLSTTSDNDGKFIFATVLAKQKYTLNVIANNYTQYYQNITADTSNIDLNNVKLQYNLTPAVGVTLNVKGKVILGWDRAPIKNGFFEDFEKYDDFTLDFTPFRTIDVDQYKTGNFQANAFPHRYEPMAYIVFNPKTTNPALYPNLDGKLVYSGDRIASAFFPYDDKRKPASVNNNDWLITPQVYIDTNARLQFEARTFRSYDGRYEKFKVLISTNGHNIEDFVEIAQCDSTPLTWTNYSYDLSAYKGQYIYAAIQCVSYNVQMFMVDNLRIMNSYAATEPEFVNYKVYRLEDGDMRHRDNWTLLGETTEKTYTDTQVKIGTRYAIIANYTNGRTTLPAFSCAVAVPELRVSKDTLSFKNIPIDVTSAAQTLTVTGFNLVEKITYTLSGTDASVFTVTPDNTWDTLSGGILSITFKPTASKSYYASLILTSGTANKTVYLKGNEGTVSISDITKNENTISIYPNPVSNKATINAPSAITEIHIYNNTGQLLKIISGSKTLQQTCDFSGLIKGTYYIKIETVDKKTSTLPVIVQ